MLRKPLTNTTNKEVIELPKEGSPPPTLQDYLKMVSRINMEMLCLPLKDLGIRYFQYVKKTTDNEYLHLSNLPGWLSYFFEKKHYLNCFFHDPHKKYSPGNYLWEGLSNQHIICKELRDLFGINHGITHVKIYQDSYEFFHFGAEKSQYEINNLYLNHFYLFERFILYFKDNLTNKILNELPKSIIVPSRDDITSNPQPKPNISQFYEQTDFNNYYLPNLEYLTRREIECLKWYLRGKTAPEIAIILNLSPRTIEGYINSIKNKTQCFNRSQLYLQFNYHAL